MTQADSVHSTPPINTSASTSPGAAEKPQDSLYLPTPVTPEEAFQAIGRLRKHARYEIDRLIRFLDETDNHMELEDGADDESTLGSGDDRECDTSDDEPSLGSHEIRPGGAVSYLSHPIQAWDTSGETYIDGEDEYDGREDDSEDEGAQCEDEGAADVDREPSLGWTVGGYTQNTTDARCDAELQEHPTAIPAKPRKAKGVNVENRGYGGRKLITGMTSCQVDRVAPRLDRYGLISTDTVNTRGLV